MKNLAGTDQFEADNVCERELRRCGIEVVRGDVSTGEVKTALTGKIGPVTLERKWVYWQARGHVPLDVAKRLYAHSVSAEIRAFGHCGRVDPESRPESLSYFAADGSEVISDPDGEESAQWDALAARYFQSVPKPCFVPDAAGVAAKVYVDTYHIDSELGLYVFAQEVGGLK